MANFRQLILTYKTFPAELPRVQATILDVMGRMELKIRHRRTGPKGSARILASGWRRKLYVELEPRGSEGTRARVLTKEGAFFGDDVAGDLASCVARLLEAEQGGPNPGTPGNVPLSGPTRGGEGAPAFAV